MVSLDSTKDGTFSMGSTVFFSKLTSHMNKTWGKSLRLPSGYEAKFRNNMF